MLRLVLVLLVCFSAQAQQPQRCITPSQFHARISQYDHGNDLTNHYIIEYDAVNQRRVMFEEMNAVGPGKKFYEYLTLAKENVEYKFDMQTHECTKAPSRPWRNFEIPVNATFETEFTLGGPGESFMVQEWSDRVPFRRNAMLVIQTTIANCFPVQEVLISNYNETQTITTNFYDIVEGIPNPNDFIIPRECTQPNYVQKDPITSWP